MNMAYSTIKIGSNATEDVKTWQEFLKGQGYNISVDGKFGKETDGYTKEWQTKNGLTADGIVGKNTWASMNVGNTNTNTNNTPAATPSTINGVSQEIMDKAYNNTYTPNDAIKEAEGKKNDALSNYENYVGNTNIVDQSVYDTLGKELVIPEEVTKADAWIASQLEKIQSGKTSYTDQINSLMDKIMNRDSFEYDVDNDQLFQQALASAMNSGRTAMQDTIGQASSLTGGYGSTYATTAGNQAYNQFIEDAYNNLPEYYQMAMEAYQMEGQEMYNQLNMLNTADANEWNKLITGYDATYQHRNQLYNEAYTAHRDEKTDALNIANLQLSEHQTVSNDLFNLYNAYSTDYESLYQKDYQSWADNVAMNQQLATLLNSDAWATKNYEQTEKWNQKDLDYKYAQLSEEKRQYNYSIGDTNNDGVVDEEEKAALNQYENWINPDDIEVDEETGAIINIKGHTIAGADGKGTKNSPAVDGFRPVTGDNFTISIGDKEYKVENWGKVKDNETNKEKLKALEKADAYGDIRVYNGKAYIKYNDEYYQLGDLGGFMNIGTSSKSGYADLLLALGK